MDTGENPLELLARDRPYAPEAYDLVLRGLNFLLAELDEPRHVSGSELADALRRYALNEFGPMAKHVLNRWGIETTRDFGEIVFDLVAAGLLRKTDDDRIDDFTDCFDFATAFERGYYAQTALGQ
jgi:uncharacterized repeat protein (TIGR04138 family)